MTFRIFYAGGPGNVIEAHEYWMAGTHYPNEVSITYSSQFEDFCRDVGAEAYIIAGPRKRRFIVTANSRWNTVLNLCRTQKDWLSLS